MDGAEKVWKAIQWSLAKKTDSINRGKDRMSEKPGRGMDNDNRGRRKASSNKRT